MDIDGVTAIGEMNQVVMAGGPVEKASDTSSTNYYQGGVNQKLICGDKFGSVHLLDVSRKIVIEKFDVP